MAEIKEKNQSERELEDEELEGSDEKELIGEDNETPETPTEELDRMREREPGDMPERENLNIPPAGSGNDDPEFPSQDFSYPESAPSVGISESPTVANEFLEGDSYLDGDIPTNPNSPAKTEEPEKQKKEGKKPGKWLSKVNKIPGNEIFSPRGFVAVLFLGFVELIDLIPGAGVDTLTWELILEIMVLGFFYCLFSEYYGGFFKFLKEGFVPLIIAFIIERVPVLSEISPSLLLVFPTFFS